MTTEDYLLTSFIFDVVSFICNALMCFYAIMITSDRFCLNPNHLLKST